MNLPTLPTEPSKRLPLLRSIAREIRERSRSVRELETLRDAFAKAKIHESDLANVVAELAIQRRELRTVEKELERLGCRLDERDPLRISVPAEGRAYTFSWELDQTQFYHQPLKTTAAEPA